MPTSQISEVLRHLRSAALRAEGTELTDAQLLESFLGGRDAAALEALVRRHGPMVWGTCRRILRDHHDAEDAFQATFLVLVRRAAAVLPRELVGNWLYGVAYQTAMKARAKRAKWRVREAQQTTMPEPTVTDPELWGDLRPLLDQELTRLPDRYRAVVVLCDLEGKSRKEAARQLGVPEGTVGSRLARGRALLARRLARHGLAVSGGVLAGVLAREASAAVPTSVLCSTIKAVTAVAAGQAAAGFISAKVAALTGGVLKTMLLTKLKSVAAVTLALVVTLGIGAGLLGDGKAVGGQTPNAKPGDQPAKPPGARVDVGKGTWREMLTMKHEHAITALACSADWSAAGDDAGNMFAWNTKTGKNRKTLLNGGKNQLNTTVDRLQFTADEKDLYTPDGKSLYVIVGGPSGQFIMRYFVKDKKLEGGHGYGGGGYLGVSADAETSLELFREGKGVNLRRNAYEFKMGKFFVRPNYDPNHFETVEYEAKVSHAVVSAGDKWLAVATDDGTLHIHDRTSLKETHTIGAGKEGVAIKDVQFSADGKRIAVARDDALAKVYDTAKGEEVATLKGGHSGIVFAVAFSPDGKQVVTGGDDNTARIWDAATGKALAKLEGHTDSVRCVAFDPSGEILVTGSADKTVKLWTVR